jgi:hypothetical protein
LNESGLRLFYKTDVINMNYGPNNYNFGTYRIDLVNEYLTIRFGSRLECDDRPDQKNLGDWHITNNVYEWKIYISGPPAHDDCEHAKEMPIGQWVTMENIGTTNQIYLNWEKHPMEPNCDFFRDLVDENTNDKLFQQLNGRGESPEVWGRVWAPGPGFITVSMRTSEMEPNITPWDVSFWVFEGDYLRVTEYPQHQEDFLHCANLPFMIWDPPRRSIDYWRGRPVDVENWPTVPEIHMYNWEYFYFAIQRNNCNVPEHFFIDVKIDFTPYAPSPFYLGNNTCNTAYPIPDDVGDFTIEASTRGASNNFMHILTFDWFERMSCYGDPMTRLPDQLTNYNTRAADVVFKVPVYEGQHVDVNVAPGPAPYQFCEPYLTAYMMERCRGGDWDYHKWGINIEPLCNMRQGVGWGDTGVDGAGVTFDLDVLDDGDNWLEEPTEYTLVVDSWFRTMYVDDCYHGNFELNLRKELPCDYHDIDVGPYVEFYYVNYGQTEIIYDNSGRHHPTCEGLGEIDARAWWMATEQDLVNWFMYLAERTPEWMDLMITGNELVRIGNTVKIEDGILYLTADMVQDFVHSSRYWIDLGPFEKTHEFTTTFTKTSFILLGLSCEGCPGYKYKMFQVVVAPPPELQAEAIIIKPDGTPVPDAIDVTLGEEIPLVGTANCPFPGIPGKSLAMPGVRFNWYEETRDQNVPLRANELNLNYVAKKTQSRLILEAQCYDDPIKGYIEAFDTLVINAARAKPPVATDDLAAGEIKVGKARFVGGNETLTINYMPEGTAGSVTLKVYDLRGRLIRTLETSSAAAVEFSWDGRNDANEIQPAGTYVWQIEGDGTVKSGVTVLTR